MIELQIEVPSKHFPLNRTLCSNLNFFISSFDEKLISLDTALHFRIFFGTLATEKIQTKHVNKYLKWLATLVPHILITER
jgi:hypothetical protein